MLQRFIKGNTDNIKIMSKFLSVILVCLITMAVLLCISAFAISHIDFSYETLPAVVAAILGISSALDSYLISKLSKENGLFWGVFVGIIIFACLLVISVYSKSFNMTANFFIKSAISVIAGAIGGIVGVNTN